MIDLSLLRDSGKFSADDKPRIAFVHHGFRTTQLEIIDKRRPRFSPRYASLGLLSLARSIEEDFKYGRISSLPEMQYFDEDCYEDDSDLERSISEWLRFSKAGYILVGLYTLAFDRTADFISRFDSGEFCIVVGGAHPTVAPDVDFAHLVVRGEGGVPIRHVLNKLFRPGFGEGSEAHGICYQIDGKVYSSSPAFDKSIATIAPPAFAYHLSQSRTNFIERPRDRWWRSVGNATQIYICTQSCRARCTFCSTYMIHGRLVSRPVEFIESDLNCIVDEFGHDSIHFHDDDLLQHEQFDELMDLLSRKKITWGCNARVEFMTIERAEQMYRSGCTKVFLGVESLNQESLNYYRKNTTVEMNRAAVENLAAAGIAVICGFIIGAPHDTLQSILEELDMILELPIYFISTAILTPDIGTVEYHRARKKIPEMQFLGDEGSKVNLHPRPDIFGSNAPFGLPTVCDSLSKDKLNELYKLVNCEFFLRESAYNRIALLTLPDRMEEVNAWYNWMFQCAEGLLNETTLAPIRKRVDNVLSNSWIQQFASK
jgi:radical SAM superfamily enzyme YgiQ (UPF0313 family)